MPISGCSLASCSACPPSPSPRNSPPFRRTCRCSKLFRDPVILLRHGCADLRLAVVSPFVDRRHGTERSLAELLERLARDYHCEIHLYSQRVENLAIGRSSALGPQERGEVIWHKVPAIPGPHLVQFVFWLFLNTFLRRWDRAIRGL